MSSSDGIETGFAAALGSAGIAAVPLLHTGQREAVSPAQLRRRLHDLSNTLTGLLGNLELAGMSAEDGELDSASLASALDAARCCVLAIRELKQQFDQHFPHEHGTS